MSLDFNERKYEILTAEREGKHLTYRAFEHIPYCEHPLEQSVQCLSIFVPEDFYNGRGINGYSLKTAPIFLPNTVGGYMPGPEERPGVNFMGETNASFFALLHGYVVVSAGIRGRGMKDTRGKNIGTAPAHIVDLKAAVRYLRHNAEKIPGNTEKIISNGTSAGGALSALLGSSGNHPDYEMYLRETGAAEERDDIFAASCYCPITNLDHADTAYEWEFSGINDFHSMKFEPAEPDAEKPKITKIDGTMTQIQQELSVLLKSQFPAYVESLHLKDESGNTLLLDSGGNGSFKEYVKSIVIKSVQREAEKGTDLSDFDRIVIRNGKVVWIDFDAYIKFRTRMKVTPAFDGVSLDTAENELFGTADIKARHFTVFSREHSTADASLAPLDVVKLMNPMYYIDDPKAVKAGHFRIRHGAIDRDTSLAISTMLLLKLKNEGIDAELEFPWGRPHSGDYDLPELFTWIDEICK
ncbi:MAG TPA: alpha/beta hydrolase [Treponema sp.]|nr:alpha/beta hydrolase [Treponema sp.]